MKLSSKLNKYFIVLLIITISVSAITSIYIFSNSFERFANIERKQKFDLLSEDLNRLLNLNDGLNPTILQIYAESEEVHIKVYDKNNKLLFEHDGIKTEARKKNLNFLKAKYNLIDYKNNPLGYLEIEYPDNIFEYDETIREFRKEMIRNFTLIFIVLMVLGSISILFISKTITDPITYIKNQSNKIRSKNYDIQRKNFDIYELDELSSDISYLATSLSLQDKYRLDYAKDIAHELRTPITNLMLHLNGIKDNVIEADDDTINLLISETQRLSSMINSLESSFNSSENITKLEIEKVNLSELLNIVSSSFIPLMHEHSIELETHFIDEIEINTDINKFKQIISNIISNSIKAIDNDGKIIVTQKHFKNREVISISDNGIGIEKENLEHIFERFYRVDNVRNTKISGHGLGLSIVKTYIDLLGYNISVNSSLGKGTEFIITIPN